MDLGLTTHDRQPCPEVKKKKQILFPSYIKSVEEFFLVGEPRGKNAVKGRRANGAAAKVKQAILIATRPQEFPIASFR